MNMRQRKRTATAEIGTHGRTATTPKRIKTEASKALSDVLDNLSSAPPYSVKTVGDVSTPNLQSRKLAAYSQYAASSPFPDFLRPTPAECKLALRILSSLHGTRNRPATVTASTTRAGCGDSPSVVDSLVRTILSQNTSDANSSRAKRSMDATYGRSDHWEAIVAGGVEKLQEAIACGGLSKVKSRVIMQILVQVHERFGEYSLEHLRGLANDEAMAELLSFKGVGPKTASCVLLFCLGRESFAVDTHVYRISGLLGWRPDKAGREETARHLDVRIPDEDKYALHVLMVTHGRGCGACRAGGRTTGSCELRQAFKKGQRTGPACDRSVDLKS
ncbi:Base excision DNA repair protein [Pleurostoma richardsiae]|uniref:Base excision DNA repair protein n=1 Tax=Pleurostoma richardsiae TaxID=41990 RepID=A0AA38R3B1_9PEZI|nr:Base excision DNA repair protein [Pleurostoma richardsiae]